MADRPTTPGINLRVARKVVVSKDTAAALSDAFAIREHALQKLREKRNAPPRPDPFATVPLMQDLEGRGDDDDEEAAPLNFSGMKKAAMAKAKAAAKKTAAAAKAGATAAKAGAEAQAAKVQAKIDAEKALWEDAAHGDLEVRSGVRGRGRGRRDGSVVS